MNQGGDHRVDPAEQVGADPADRGHEVLPRTADGLAHLVSDGARRGGRSGCELVEADLALGGHGADLVGGDPELIGECLPDRQSAVGELVDVLGVGLACGGDLVEDRAGLVHAGLGRGRDVGDALEHVLQLLTGADTRGHSAGGGGGGGVEAERGALHRGGGVLHDLVNGGRVVTETAKLRLGILDRAEA